jgi:hypothetical protein
VRLIGPAAVDGRLRIDTLVDIAQGVQGAVTRLAYSLRGQTTVRRGRTPAELADLTRLELVGLREGSTLLAFDLAEQERPLADFDLGSRALATFEAGIAALASGAPSPEAWDAGVVQAAEQVMRALDRGIDEIVVGHFSVEAASGAVITRSTRDRLRGLRPVGGVRERVEIEGRLLTADFATTRDEARIHRPLEPPVRCRFGPELEATVLRLLRRYVQATGWTVRDEGGAMGMLELESLEDVEPDGRTFWELPTLEELAEEQGVQPVERMEDLASDFWPEGESVDAFLAAIESCD